MEEVIEGVVGSTAEQVSFQLCVFGLFTAGSDVRLADLCDPWGELAVGYLQHASQRTQKAKTDQTGGVLCRIYV
jgi:hypothetical protein